MPAIASAREGTNLSIMRGSLGLPQGATGSRSAERAARRRGVGRCWPRMLHSTLGDPDGLKRLELGGDLLRRAIQRGLGARLRTVGQGEDVGTVALSKGGVGGAGGVDHALVADGRSEERRVGKECRS